MTTALLIIDVQSALCAGAWAAFDIDNVIARINAVSARARAAGVPVIIVQHEDASGPFQFGTAAWKLPESLLTHEKDARIRKSTPDSFHQTGLQPLLDKLGITRLIVCGLQSDFCVDTTVRRALALGYPVVLVADAHSTVDNGVLSAQQITAHHNATLANITSFGPRVTVLPASEVRVESA
ncbi:MAG TPA: cysteine hydrolase family protein [Povalibacter sp.]|nr:cysteine hydrolase family protein [Povalibacter sp.]